MYLNQVVVEGYRAADSPLVVDLPGRLSLLVGPNNAGKTTVCEAIHQAMRSHFPPVSRPPSDVVHGNAGRISLSFAAGPDGGGPLDLLLSTPAVLDVEVGRNRQRATFGLTQTSHPAADMLARAMSIYLPADRQPARELAWENAFLIVQLLRTVAREPDATGDLPALYGRATELLEQILEDPLVGDLEQRLQERMRAVAGGVATETPYVGTSAMDQRLLARILELLLGDGARETARRLELAGLGYANLLHLSAILTALPKPTDPAAEEEDAADSEDGASIDQGVIASEAGEAADGDIFPSDTPLFVLIIEEPEAHLHPQLHANVLSELRNLVAALPTLQVIVSSHSAEIVGLAEPEEIIVLPGRRQLPSVSTATTAGEAPAITVLPVTAITLADLKNHITPPAWDETRRMLRLHLDATRSAAIFSRRVLLVEGPTDAVLFRECGRTWAKGGGSDEERVARLRFIETLSIVAMNHKVGEWAVRLLATPGFEVTARVAVVRDSDKRPKGEELTEAWLLDNPPKDPKWIAPYDPQRARLFELHPTLEPALWRSDRSFVQSVIDVLAGTAPGEDDGDDEKTDRSDADVPDETPLTAKGTTFDKKREPEDTQSVAWVDWFFRFGPGHSDKGAFALLAADHARETGRMITLPEPLQQAFDYLWAGLFEPEAIPGSDAQDT